MITRCLRATNVLSYSTPAMIRGFATKKDYYQILGLNADATTDEIKNAYRSLAKQYHPDVNATGEVNKGDAERFRDVVEAYQVLNTVESRTAYDLQNQAAPDFVYRAQRMEQLRKFTDRGRDGNPKKEAYPAGSYAEFKRNFLANERKKFNVDPFGRYKGGVPQRGKGVIRGNALGYPGSYHDPLVHNFKVTPDPDSQFVTSADALAFKNYMNEDRYSLKRRVLWFQAKVDFDYFKFETYRYGFRWFRNTLFLLFSIVGLSVIFTKAQNRAILSQARKLEGQGSLKAGVEIQGRRVVQGPTGIIRLEEAQKHHGHHH